MYTGNAHAGSIKCKLGTHTANRCWWVCPQKRDVSSEDKEKFPYDIVKMALPPEAQLAADSEVQINPLFTS